MRFTTVSKGLVALLLWFNLAFSW